MQFRDRKDAGVQLAQALNKYQQADDTIVLGLPRGGVPIAYEIAIALDLPLDVFLVRKLGTPGQEELAFGAIAENGACIYNEDIVQTYVTDTAENSAEISTDDWSSRRLVAKCTDFNQPLSVIFLSLTSLFLSLTL